MKNMRIRKFTEAIEANKSNKFPEVIKEIKSLIESTIKRSGGEFKSFINSFMEEPKEGAVGSIEIEGLIDESDIHDFYLKYRNQIDETLNDINFYDKTYKKTHPTQKPYKLIERIINCSTNTSDNVLDIFMGSGMTGLVCKNTERNFYGCELDVKYLNDNLLNT